MFFRRPYRQDDLFFGTTVSQAVAGVGRHKARAVTGAVRGMLAGLEERWSVFRGDSELTRLRRQAGAGAVPVSADTRAVLRLAVETAGASGGAFDPTMAPLTRLWRAALRRGGPPSAAAIEARLPLVDAAAVVFPETGCVCLPRPGMAVELGAIGKGWGADRAGELYREAGIRSAWISIGGDVLTIGGRPDGEPWRIGVQDPHGARGAVLGYLTIRDRAVAGSGAYERCFHLHGKTYHHILDPRSGRPAMTDLAGVTVVAASAATADAFATAFFVAGSDGALALLASLAGVEAILVLEDRRILVSAGLREWWHPAG